jgi:hypothetical protein
MSARRGIVRMVLLAVAAATALTTAGAAPVGAQQLIDAGGGHGEGGVAFVAFTVMVVLVAGALFYMDRVRRTREERERLRDQGPGAPRG